MKVRWLIRSLCALFVFSLGMGVAGQGVLADEGNVGFTFYPSVEAVYIHDDNFFLAPEDDVIGPGEVSADTWLLRPRLAFEAAGRRGFFSFAYMPQYREVDGVERSDLGGVRFSLEEDVTHFVDITGRYRAPNGFSFSITENFVKGVLETTHVDPNRELFFGDDPFVSSRTEVRFDYDRRRAGGGIILRLDVMDFDRDRIGASFFDSETYGARFEGRYHMTPLTTLTMFYEHIEMEQDFYAGTTQVVRGRESDRDTFGFAFDGELSRTITGVLTIAFSSSDFGRSVNSDFSGLRVNALVTKAFTLNTKLALEVERSENLSNFIDPVADNGSNFYVANRATLTLGSQASRNVFWTLAGGYQENDYPDRRTFDFNLDGITDFSVFREDEIVSGRAEIGFHTARERLTIKLNYRYEERDSNVQDSAGIEVFDYTDNQFLFQIAFGIK